MPVEGPSKVRQKVRKDRRCQLSVSLKIWLAPRTYSGIWNWPIQDQPLMYQIHAPGSGILGEEVVIICLWDDLTLCEQKTSLRHGMPPWAGASGLSRAAKSCSYMGVTAKSLGPEMANSGLFFPSEWPPWRQINKSDRGRESHAAELSARQKGKFNSALLRTEPQVSLSEIQWHFCLFVNGNTRLSFGSRMVVFCLQCPCSPGLIVCWEEEKKKKNN